MKNRITGLLNDIPKSWNDLYAWQFSELSNLELERENYEDYDYIFEQLGILLSMDSDDDIFYNLNEKEVLQLMKTQEYLKEFKNETPLYLEFEGKEYIKIDFNNMNVAEWITLEFYIKNNHKINCTNIMSLIYRRFKRDDWDNIVIEPFEFNIQERSKLFENVTLEYYPIKEFLEFRNKCYSSYMLSPTRLDEDEEEEEIEETEEEKKLNYRERSAIKEEEAKKNLNSSYMFEKILMNLTNENVVDSYKMLELPVLYVFGIVSMQNRMAT